MTDDEVEDLQDRLRELTLDAALVEKHRSSVRRALLEESLRRLKAEPDEENDIPYEPGDLKNLVYTDRPCSNKRNVLGCCCTLYEDCLFCEWSSHNLRLFGPHSSRRE